jgi:hypothetical protein
VSIPAGVVTVLVSALPQTTGPVVPSSISVSVTPTANLIWAATGQPLVSMCGQSPTPGWVTLPAVDQLGFVTPDTRIGVTGWAYLITVTWTQTDGSMHSESGQISCLTNQSISYLANVSGVLQTPTPGFPGTAVALLVMTGAQYSALSSTDPSTLYFTY